MEFIAVKLQTYSDETLLHIFFQNLVQKLTS